jgi:hypothetical protein
VQTLDRDELSIYVAAPPQAVYDVVSDVTRTPEYSPEIRRCTWLDGATGPVVGARFAAVNKIGGGPSWTNRPVVTVADPPREFAFARTEKLVGTLEWRYCLVPEGEGTRVTESYEVTRPISRLGWFIIGTLHRHKDRRAGLHQSMGTSLERLRVLVESGRPATPTR